MCGARQPSLEPVEAPRHADAAHARRMNLPNSEDLKQISADGGERMRTQHTTRPVRPLRAWFVKRVAVPAELDIISCADAAAWDAWLAANHRRHQGVWLKIAKQHTGVVSGSTRPSVTRRGTTSASRRCSNSRWTATEEALPLGRRRWQRTRDRDGGTPHGVAGD